MRAPSRSLRVSDNEIFFLAIGGLAIVLSVIILYGYMFLQK